MGALSTVQKFLTTQFNIDGEGTLGGILNILKEFIGFLIGEATDGLSNFGNALNNLNLIESQHL